MIDLAKTRILVTGGHGFLGSHVLLALKKRGAEQVYAPRSAEYDLVELEQVRQLLDETRPELVLHLAARVGGIYANQLNPGKFFYDNLMMGVQLLHECSLRPVKKLVAVSTICAYPKHCPIPFREEDLWNGYPEETNAPYGIAKKALGVMSAAYRAQYQFNSVVVYPVNLYGPQDNFDLDSGHVVPALLRKFHQAKLEGSPKVVLWGDGSPTREFFYAPDCAEALLRTCELYDESEPMNLGSGFEISIAELAQTIADLVGYSGQLVWDTSKPNGQPRRRLEVSRAQEKLGFVAQTSLEQGLRRTYEWYLSQQRGPELLGSSGTGS